MRRLRGGATAAVVLALAVAGCKGGATPADGGPSGSAVPTSGDARAVSPLDNPDGTKPGLAPVTSAADKARARSVIAKVATKGRGPKTGYARDEFGYAWTDSAPGGIPFSHNGCDSRNDLLKRDGENVRFRSGSNCVVTSMTLHDPYTGKTIGWSKSHATTVQIDHVMPLSYDWQMGASRWTKGKREDIANDPLNLIPVDGPTNGAKSDSGPATWLPPNKQIRCSYALRFAQVSLKYALPVTPADKQTMLNQCGG
ncbi:HNH endonuclease family protein [Streptomyces naganishii]|uniref:HNH endonuclease family protein n=1 Tax=Streptomyces naganishii TaxID=285447 RepID=UPI00167CE241|nr:HNH endonuclease family protein [Streptomyces naganishii]